MAMPSEQLRTIIETCGVSRHELAKRSGVTAATLSRFVNGKHMMTLDAVDRLNRVLPLKITAGKLKKEG